MVKIISDSTSDLTKELIDKLDISVIPLHILLGNDEYRDGIDITPDKIYEWADENKTTPKTSAVSIDDTIEMFKCVLEEDRDIVAFAISEDMSTKLALTLGLNSNIFFSMSAADMPFPAITAASTTRCPIPVDRFSESIT